MSLASRSSVENQPISAPLMERARAACRTAKQLEKVGDYDGAYAAMAEFWPDREKPPNLEDLDELTKAEVLLRLGALAGWMGASDQAQDSQELAKDFITKSIEIFEGLGAAERVAEAHGDLALCYWRQGAYDEARVNLDTALARLGGKPSDLRAVLLIRAGVIETWAQKPEQAMQYYEQAAPLVESSSDHALKGTFHNEYGLVYRRLAAPENREDYLDRALLEYTAASFHFGEAGNSRYVAFVELNLGFLYFTIKRFQEAHHHLDRARSLLLDLKDVGTAAQVDETRARTLLAEGRLRDAERMIKGAIKVLEKGDQQAVLAEALITYGAIAARMGNHARAALLLQRAIVMAETVGDREGSGRAHLTIVEELGGHTPLKQLAEVYGSAVALLDRSQDPTTNKRLIACARRVIDAFLAEEQHPTSPPEVDSWQGFSLRAEIRKIEKLLIERALRDAGGSVTKASQLLGFRHHQSLIGLINSRHRELLPQRSIVRRRRRHLFSEPKRTRKKVATANSENLLTVLHVEDHKPVARLVKDALADGYRVQSCANGLAALDFLKTDTRVDVLIVDNNLPGISGLELVLRGRSLVHRRNLPIIMLAGDDVEKEAWRAGVDAFLPKSEAANQLAATVKRLLAEKDSDDNDDEDDGE